ncbi:leucine--tRNA ligase [bacterium]|nr:leucine--tRNA ligase [bacterium]
MDTDNTARGGQRAGRYNHIAIEKKWQDIWEDRRTFVAPDSDPRPKMYVLQMFPYPSGNLHAGHVRNYVIGDAMARFWRMKGYNVMHPMGYDSFGLPAEQAAIDRKIQPADWIDQCISTARRQFKRYGFSFDWTREVNTSAPEYYKWTQWLFTTFYRHGLVYRKQIEVNWCEEHGVLANDEVKDGACWRCDREVSKKKMAQWLMRTTDYAQELLDGLDDLPGWTQRVVKLQTNWIGRSEGTHADFAVPAIKDSCPQGSEPVLRIYTTRVDTIFGCTFMAVAPDHPLAEAMASVGGTTGQLATFQEECASEDVRFKVAEEKPKRGIPLGVSCVNPFNGEEVPVWATNYVVSDFGTGAVMAVPAHDTRDHAFAKEFGLPIREVVVPDDGSERGDVQAEAWTGKGRCINSGEFDNMDFHTAKAAMDNWLMKHHKGGSAVQYRLRDWNMGRQRFWGAPIPMVHCGSCGWQPVPDSELPVRLPNEADYSDIRVSPLANDEDWKRAKCPACGGKAERDTDTMTTFMCSAWYFLRFCDPHNDQRIFDPARVAAWMPVDYYIGGQEHAVGHLLYSRFITMVLQKLGYLELSRPDFAGELPKLGNEPFRRLFNQGMVYKDGAKMSKSKGNVVSSDELADEYGADTARIFGLFGGPADQDLEWTTSGVEGGLRFLRRVYRLGDAVANAGNSPDSLPEAAESAVRARHRAVAGVTEDLTNWRFNTAIAKQMEYLNELEKLWQQCNETDQSGAFRVAMTSFAQLLSPFAPHVAEELWEMLGGPGLCADSEWPIHDPSMLIESTLEIPVQVNGKLRGRISVPANASQEQCIAAARNNDDVARWLEGKEVLKEIFVPGRMITFVVKG